MFDPSKLQATRAIAGAKRRVQKWALEVLDKEKNKHYDALKNATINIREIQCNDPLCATTGELDTVVSLTTPLMNVCLLYTSPSPRDLSTSRMPSSA